MSNANTTPVDNCNCHNLFSPQKGHEMTPEHRRILDDLRAACTELETVYGLTWHLRPRFPTRYERLYGKAA